MSLLYFALILSVLFPSKSTWLGNRVKAAFEAATLWLVMLWRVLEGIYRAGKWVRKQVKLWRREPAYGNAEFANLEVLRKSGNIDGKGYPVGLLGKTLVNTHREAHLVIFGKTGYGKSLTLGKSLHEASGESFIEFEPKGQHRKMFQASLEAKGYRILHLDLNNPTKGIAYDPLAFFKNSIGADWDRDFNTVARLVVGDWTSEDEESASKHFAEMAFLMVGGTLADMVTFEPEKASLEHLANIWGVYSESSLNKHFDKMMSRSSRPITRMAVNAFQRVGDKERGSIFSTIARKLEPWTRQDYRELCHPRGEAWCWEDIFISPVPVCLFVTGGIGDLENLPPFMRMFYGQAVASANRYYKHTQQPLIRPHRFVVDEASLVSGCKPLVAAITQLRSTNVQVCLSFQDTNQLNEAFGKQAKTVFSNCDLSISGGLSSSDYREIVEKVGKRTVMALSKGEHGISESEAGQALLDIAGMFSLPREKHLCLLGTLAAILDKPYSIKDNTVVY